MSSVSIIDAMVGKLKMLETGRWGIIHANTEGADEITSGESIFLEIPGSGALGRTRIETRWNKQKGAMEYYSVDNFTLREGLRAVKAPMLI